MTFTTRALAAGSAVLVAAAAASIAFAVPAAAVATPLGSTLDVRDGTILNDLTTALVPVTYTCESGTTQTITIRLSGGANNGDGSKVVECTGVPVTDTVTVKAYIDYFAASAYAFVSLTDGTKLTRQINLRYAE